MQLYCNNTVQCSCAQITRGKAENLIAADNKKVSLKYALDSKMITQVTLQFYSLLSHIRLTLAKTGNETGSVLAIEFVFTHQ